MLELAWGLLLLVNVGALLVYGFDKLRARGTRRRVPERTLLWFVGLGGFVGSWLAMTWFRHKTQKASFRRWALLWTVVNPFWLVLWWTFGRA